MHRARPSTTVRSIRLRTSRRPPARHPPPKEGREARLKARTKPGLLNKCLPLFCVSELALLYAAFGVNKRTSVDKGPAKISPRGPFRGNPARIRGFLFFGRGISWIKREPANATAPTLLFISSFIRMWRNCRPCIVGMSIISSVYCINYYAVYAGSTLRIDMF